MTVRHCAKAEHQLPQNKQSKSSHNKKNIKNSTRIQGNFLSSNSGLAENVTKQKQLYPAAAYQKQSTIIPESLLTLTPETAEP